MLERLFSDVTPNVARILDATLSGQEPSRADALRLLQAEGADLLALVRAADVARKEDNGDDVSFVINRNINFTNRSEEHTSELQSLRHLVCRLLLEKKKKK